MAQNLRSLEAISLYIVTLIAIFLFKKSNHQYIKLYIIWLLIASIVETILRLFYSSFPDGRLVRYLYAVLAPINALIFYQIFKARFQHNLFYRRLNIFFITAFFLYSAYNMFFRINEVGSFNDTFLALSILILSFCLRYFYQLFSQTEINDLRQEPLFWLSTGMLFYFSLNIFSTGFFHSLNKVNVEFSNALFNINYLVGIIYHILGGVAIYLSTKSAYERD